MYSYSCLNQISDFNFFETPISIYLKITNDCCFHCHFCSAGKAKAEYMDITFAKKILSSCKKDGVETIYYTGGEPLMHPDIKEIVKFGYDLGLRQVILTNGFLLKSSKIHSLFKWVDIIGVSLHGTEKLHDEIVTIKGATAKILTSLDKISQVYPALEIGINCTLTEKNANLNELEFLARVAKKYNGSLSISRLNFAGKAKTNFKLTTLNNVVEIIQLLREQGLKVEFGNCVAHCLLDKSLSYLGRGCAAGISSVCIEANGDLKICPSASFTIGNVKKKTLRSLWNSKKLIEFRSLRWVPPQCTACEFLRKCRVGCKIEVSGSFSTTFTDVFLTDYFSKIWQQIRTKKYVFCGDFIRKDFHYYSIISPSIIRKCDKKTLSLIKKLSGDITCEDIVKNTKDKENCKNILIALKIDNLLKERG